jgi:hypothetical protein
MLTYLGTQKTVRTVNGNATNTFKYSSGETVFPSAGSVSQAGLGAGVVGNYSPSAYNSTKCYFLSRGASQLYADTMSGLAIDIAATINVSPQALLEQSEIQQKLLLSPNAYRTFNIYRDPGNQVGVVTTVKNRYSLQAREIRS